MAEASVIIFLGPEYRPGDPYEPLDLEGNGYGSYGEWWYTLGGTEQRVFTHTPRTGGRTAIRRIASLRSALDVRGVRAFAMPDGILCVYAVYRGDNKLTSAVFAPYSDTGPLRPVEVLLDEVPGEPAGYELFGGGYATNPAIYTDGNSVVVVLGGSVFGGGVSTIVHRITPSPEVGGSAVVTTEYPEVRFDTFGSSVVATAGGVGDTGAQMFIVEEFF